MHNVSKCLKAVCTFKRSQLDEKSGLHINVVLGAWHFHFWGKKTECKVRVLILCMLFIKVDLKISAKPL